MLSDRPPGPRSVQGQLGRGFGRDFQSSPLRADKDTLAFCVGGVNVAVLLLDEFRSCLLLTNVTVPAPPACPCVKPTCYSSGRGAEVFCAAGLQVRWFELVLLMRGLLRWLYS